MKLFLPNSLWSNNHLHVPPGLDAAYLAALEAHDLAAQAHGGEGGAVGGEDDGNAAAHFATRFGVSAARALAVLFDPSDLLDRISDDLLPSFAGETLIIADIACGSGVASLTFLEAIAELRRAGALPSLPLEVIIHGCDFNPWSLARFRELHDALLPTLEGAAIDVTLVIHSLDLRKVMDARSFMEGIEASARDNASAATLVDVVGVIAAISGTAGAKNFTEAQQSFEPFRMSIEHIKVRMQRPNWTFVWLEPSVKKTEGLMKVVGKLWKQLSEPHGARTATYRWWNSLKSMDFPCRITVEWERHK